MHASISALSVLSFWKLQRVLLSTYIPLDALIVVVFTGCASVLCVSSGNTVTTLFYVQMIYRESSLVMLYCTLVCCSCRFWTGSGNEKQAALHRLCQHTMVPSTRSAAQEPKLWQSHRFVCYGGDYGGAIYSSPAFPRCSPLSSFQAILCLPSPITQSASCHKSEVGRQFFGAASP